MVTITLYAENAHFLDIFRNPKFWQPFPEGTTIGAVLEVQVFFFEKFLDLVWDSSLLFRHLLILRTHFTL